MKIRILMGLPGAGKSTWIRQNTYGYVTVCSTDLFHTMEGGYSHPGRDAERAKAAHGHTLRKFIETIQGWFNAPMTCARPPGEFLVVDNTNTTQYELGPYIAVANAYGLASLVEVHYLKCSPEMSLLRNTHNVPPDIVALMHNNLKSLLADWPKPWPAPIVHDMEPNRVCSSCSASAGQGHDPDPDCNSSYR